jgi:hypothetical protein
MGLAGQERQALGADPTAAASHTADQTDKRVIMTVTLSNASQA